MLYYTIVPLVFKYRGMITITDVAAGQVKKMLDDDSKNFLRLAVSGGGCSGFQYMLQLADNKDDQDKLFEDKGVKIIIDPISFSYVNGSIIDFTDNMIGGGFTVANPSAKSTCGCGMSFEK